MQLMGSCYLKVLPESKTQSEMRRFSPGCYPYELMSLILSFVVRPEVGAREFSLVSRCYRDEMLITDFDGHLFNILL